MIRYSFLFLVIGLIPLLTYGSSYIGGEIAFSVIPGWHTVIYPPGYIFSLWQMGWMMVLPVIYFLLEKRQAGISKKIMMFHLICTLTYFINLDPVVTSFYNTENKWLSFVPMIIFAAGQLVFLVLALKAFAAGKPE